LLGLLNIVFLLGAFELAYLGLWKMKKDGREIRASFAHLQRL
jgi:hypothetical protein